MGAWFRQKSMPDFFPGLCDKRGKLVAVAKIWHLACLSGLRLGKSFGDS